MAKRKKPLYLEKLGLAQPEEEIERRGATVCYLRVSTPGQAAEDKFGLEAQRAQVMMYCAWKEIEIAETDWYVDQESGYVGSRSAIDRLRERIESGDVREVLLANSGRLGRGLLVSETLWEALEKKCIVTSVTERFEKSAQGRFFRHMMMCYNDFEGTRLKERMFDGRLVAVTKYGRNGGGWGCYGYRSIGAGMLVIMPEEAKVVVMIFEWVASGISAAAIARELNAQKIPTMLGKRWHRGGVSVILEKREFYGGLRTLWRCPSETVQHEAILSPDLMERLATMSAAPDGLVTAQQAAKALGMGISAIRNWAREGWVEVQRINKTGRSGKKIAAQFFDLDQLREVKESRQYKVRRSPAAKSERINPPPPDLPEGQVNVKIAAEMLGMAEASVHKMLEQGVLNIHGTYEARTGARGWLLDRAEVEAIRDSAADSNEDAFTGGAFATAIAKRPA